MKIEPASTADRKAFNFRLSAEVASSDLSLRNWPMPEKFYVAAKGWVQRGGRTLVLQDVNGAWDLPGGRIDGGEFGRIAFHDVLGRELREEIGLDDAQGELLGVSQWTRAPRTGEDGVVRIFVVHFAVIAPDAFEPTLSSEHIAARWVDDPSAFLPPDLMPEALPLSRAPPIQAS